MKAIHSKSILITGASTGIGKACSLEFARLGFKVFAGVRREEDGQKVKAESTGDLQPVILDVTDAETIAAAATMITESVGEAGLWGLMNNAGVSMNGPMEIMPIAKLRRQLEVNVIGQIAVTQAVMPLLRQAQGRILFVSSINGAMSPPFMGPYSASKFAVEALADAMRLELRPWGIEVCLVEPGPIQTPIWEKSISSADSMIADINPEGYERYREATDIFRNLILESSKRSDPVEKVVRAAVHCMTARRPKTRYYLKFYNRFMSRGFRTVPDRMRDWILRKAIGLK